MNRTPSLSPNSIAFIGLCNEYCSEAVSAARTERAQFVKSMLRLLPRIYIAATDLTIAEDSAGGYIEPAMDEDLYESARRDISALMGEDDTYLEVFEEDMKYSDTPIAASISEGLADLLQVCYNFVETVKDAPESIIAEALSDMKDDFRDYWSRILCNVMRALNHVLYTSTEI